MREAVVKRSDYEHHVSPLYLHDGIALHDVGCIVVVRQKDALGIGGRAGGVGNVGVIAGLHGSDAIFEVLQIGLDVFLTHLAQLAEIHFALLQGKVVQHYHLLDGGALADDAAHFVNLALGSYDVAGIGMVDTEGKVVIRLELEGEGYVHTAGVENSQLTEYPFVAAFGDKSHFLALLKSQGHKAGRHNAAFLTGLPE